MGNGPDDRMTEREALAEAKARGYSTEQCLTCCAFTLVPYGTGYKCDTCGATTGDPPVEDTDEIPLHNDSGC